MGKNMGNRKNNNIVERMGTQMGKQHMDKYMGKEKDEWING